ncbi:MAG: cold shock domain-containing protein [Dehalococcoidia bacterium]
MATGNITRIVRDRGFGFIQPAGGTEEVFFHSSVVEQPTFDELNEGQTVEFDIEPDPKQPNRSRAARVRLGS